MHMAQLMKIVELPTTFVYEIDKEDWMQLLIDYFTNEKLLENYRKRIYLYI